MNEQTNSAIILFKQQKDSPMKKYLVLTSVLALAACGGGSGGNGGIGAPNNIVTINENDIRNSNLEVTSMVDNETQRTVYLQNALGDDYDTYAQELDNISQQNNTRQSTISSATTGFTPNPLTCRSKGTCNQLILDEMYRVLVTEIDNWENVSENDIIRALRIAGYKHEIATHNDDIRQWFRENKESIKQHAENVANAIGDIHHFDLTRAEFYSYEDILKINLDNNGKIESISIDSNPDSTVNRMSINAVRDDNNLFNTDETIYHYTLLHAGNDEYNSLIQQSDEGYSIYVASKTPLTLDELKAKLLARLDEIKDSNNIFAVFGFDPNSHTAEETQKFRNDFVNYTTTKINELQSLDNQHIRVEKEDLIATIDLETFGSQAGLAYSDFGFLKLIYPDDPQNAEMTVFYGGYNDYKQDITNVNQRMVFSGKAAGLVSYQDQVLNDHTNQQGSFTQGTLAISGDAEFVFDPSDTSDPTETLTANFENWYDVKITKTGNSASAVFSDLNNKIADNNFKFFDMNGTTGELEYKNTNTVDNILVDTILKSQTSFVTGHKAGSMDLNYYGYTESGISEVSGQVSYSENLPYYSNGINGYTDREHSIDVTFGFGGLNTFEPQTQSQNTGN